MTYTKLHGGRDEIQNGISLISSPIIFSLYGILSPYTNLLDVTEDEEKNDTMCFLKPLGLQFGMGRRHRQTLGED